jgi:hypothetical protein
MADTDAGTLKRLEKRKEALKTDRADFDPHWQELGDNVTSRRMRFTEKAGRGKKYNTNIVDPTGTYAWRTLKSGMMAGITSPARPWHRLATFDPELKEFGPVKEWLNFVERQQRDVFGNTNLYNVMHTLYGDIGLFGTFGGVLLADNEYTLRAQDFLLGEYYLATDFRGIVNTLYRRCDMNVEQCVGRFKLENCSPYVQTAYGNGDYHFNVKVWHAIEPRPTEQRDAKDHRRAKPWSSIYWEEDRKEGDKSPPFLSIGGFDESPLIAPRWDVMGNDVYASMCPGMDALPDIKQLQTQRKRYGEAVDKKVRPPMVAPTSMRGQGKSLLPGSITYSDDPNQSYRQAIAVDVDLRHLREDIEQTQDAVRQGMFADLWQMLSNAERFSGSANVTAREVEERHEEKLIQLGPVLERLQVELLKPLIDRSFYILQRAGKIPPAPPELEKQELKIEFISMLAQAQKAVATGAIERLAGYVGGIAQMKPDAVLKVNWDQSIDEMAEMLGTPPGIIVSDEIVEEERQRIQQAQAQAAQAEMATQVAGAAQQGASAANELVEATQGGTAPELLDRLGLGGMRAA